jgi:hypothetical protein
VPRQNVGSATQSLFDKISIADLPAVIRFAFAFLASPHVYEGRSSWTIANERALVAPLPLGAMRRGHAQGMTNLDIQVLDSGATVRPENIGREGYLLRGRLIATCLGAGLTAGSHKSAWLSRPGPAGRPRRHPSYGSTRVVPGETRKRQHQVPSRRCSRHSAPLTTTRSSPRIGTSPEHGTQK